MAKVNGSGFNMKLNNFKNGRGNGSDDLRMILGEGCSVEGKLICRGPTRIDGNVTGELDADELLVIDQNSTIIADIHVNELIVRGKVKGNITAGKRVLLAATAEIEGNIETPRVSIKDGAQIKGQVEVTADAKGENKSANGEQQFVDASEESGDLEAFQ